MPKAVQTRCENVAGVLLAAGESRRMGTSKALLPWHGRTLIGHQSSCYRQALGSVVIVLGYEAGQVHRALRRELGELDVEIVINERFRSGRSTSIVAGMSQVPEAKGYVIGSVDQPTEPDVLAVLAVEAVRCGALIALPSYGGRTGHPPYFRADLRTELLHVNEETEGLRAVVARHRNQVVRIGTDSPLIHLNLNTPAAYDRAYQRWGSHGV